METMNCFTCCYKHLSGALSYSKQVLSGHDGENDLDHRIDLLGELVNLEHHLELIDKNLFQKATSFRKELQTKKVAVSEADLLEIRKLYKDLENLENKITVEAPSGMKQSIYEKKNYNEAKFTVIINKPQNEQYFSLCYELLRKSILNEIEIVLVNPGFSTEKYEVKTATGSLFEAIQKEEITENFIYMKENQLIIKPFDFNFLENSYVQQPAACKEILKEAGISKFCYSWEAGKPQIMNKTKFLEVMEGVEVEDVASYYFNVTGEEPKRNSNFSVVTLDKSLCCSNKTRIGRVIFASFTNDEGFRSLEGWVRQNLTTL